MSRFSFISLPFVFFQRETRNQKRKSKNPFLLHSHSCGPGVHITCKKTKKNKKQKTYGQDPVPAPTTFMSPGWVYIQKKKKKKKKRCCQQCPNHHLQEQLTFVSCYISGTVLTASCMLTHFVFIKIFDLFCR